MPLLVEVSSGANHWAGSYGPLLVLYWIRSVEPEVCRDLAAMVPKLSARQRDKRLAVLSIAMPGAESPSQEGRVALAELLRDTSHAVTRVAVVREGHGFIASIVASVIIGIRMMARPSGGHQPFSAIEDAVPWATAELPDFTSGAIDVADATAVILQQRRILLARQSMGTSGPSLRAGAGR